MLVKLGATRPYLAEVRASFQLVSEAKIESKKRAAVIKADETFLALQKVHHATTYREIVLRASANSQERTYAALAELSVKSYTW
ncbi:hypothetical protein CYMTET_22475 [Cymbomonas tetramitiformis]|uniref:Uncharacterized protein n=1 Tax=Cymbomonas tetramitiformis TaxID=36881 RepID=A0AAE0L1V8_9CHLO|nr:hypothetical protein CYMTET_22475 [Cymbomonas tetramitiformis]